MKMTEQAGDNSIEPERAIWERILPNVYKKMHGVITGFACLN